MVTYGPSKTKYPTHLLDLMAHHIAFWRVTASGLTNKQIRMTQVRNPLPAQLDALTEAKISVLRSKGANQNPALLHDLTAATNASDYTNLVRVRCTVS
jgi:hypothetical protein